MCRWIAYAGPPIFIDRLIFHSEHSLIDQSRSARESLSAINADGFGLGWYANRETPGVFKDIQPAWNDENLRSLAEQIRSSLFFAHVRASTGTAISRANCHPFRWGRWMFMHNGKIGGYDRIRRDLMKTLSDEAFAALRGATDSEMMFRMLASNGLTNDPETALKRTVGQVCETLLAAGVEEPLSMSTALSDGETIYATRFASSGEPPSLYYNVGDPVGGADAGAGAIMIVSEPLDDEATHWAAVPANHTLLAGAGGVAVEPFHPSRVVIKVSRSTCGSAN